MRGSEKGSAPQARGRLGSLAHSDDGERQPSLNGGRHRNGGGCWLLVWARGTLTRMSPGSRSGIFAVVHSLFGNDMQSILRSSLALSLGVICSPAFAQTSDEHSPAKLQRVVTASQQSGVARRGLVVFTAAKSACVSCHKVAGHGGDVGPDLSQIGKLRKPAELVESLLWPNRKVEDKYRTHVVLTDAGKQYRGYVVERTETTVSLADPTTPAAEPIRIAVADIDEETKGGSLMPSNLTSAMTEQQVADLVRFLSSLGSDDGIPRPELKMLMMHATAHSGGPATFPHEQAPIHPEHYPHWQHFVNRDRDYDFYAKQARYFRLQKNPPMLLAQFPGVDGGQQGHWGNQNDQVTWKSDAWNHVDLGSMQSGIFNGGGRSIGRAVCVRFGDNDQYGACFNADSLAFEGLWEGGRFLRFSDFRHGFLNGVTPDGKQRAVQQVPKPAQPFRYNGFYRIGRRVLFSYRIGDTQFLDEAQVENSQITPSRVAANSVPLKSLIANSKPQWPQTFKTDIQFGTARPYAVDTITLPTKNPWNVPFFVGGVGFLNDGSVLVCTMHGDVWRVTNAVFPSKQATWKRFASGLHHPQGLVVDDEGIFVLCRDQITRLHDLNDDGEADFYECFSNAFVTSTAGHDFICGLERDKRGRFYIASGNQGIVRISPDGKTAEVIATGFRNPDGLGLLPDGTVTVPCSEGAWTPASMICAARPSEQSTFHGYRGPQDGKTPQLPLVYLPRGLDNSAGGQCIVESDRWGPLKNQLLHFSFGTGRHMLVLRDEVDGQLQGATVPLVGEFLSGAHRGRFNPKDGQLYVGGMQGWGSYTPDFGCLHRVRYTGDDVQLPIAFRAHQNGIAITFASDVDPSIAATATNHFAQCWNYRYSAAYGSPEFSTMHFGMPGHDRLAIKAAHVSDDRRTLFIEIPNIQPVNQLHLLVASNDGQEHDLFATIHRLAEPYTAFPGYTPLRKTIRPHPILADLAMATRKIVNRHIKKIPKARAVRIETGTNLSYKTRSFKAKPGEPIALTLVNPDVVPHNLVLIKPGRLEHVGAMANKLISDPEAAVRQYVPKSDDVLAHTDVAFPKSEFTIYFRAPKEPGRYPYLCTFPGHWMIMNGEMVVE